MEGVTITQIQAFTLKQKFMKRLNLLGLICLIGLSVKAQNTDWTTTATSIGPDTTDPQAKLHVKNGDILAKENRGIDFVCD